MPERRNMTDKTPDEFRTAMDERGLSIFLSEKAASRIAWILTAGVAVLTLPFIILAIMA